MMELAVEFWELAFKAVHGWIGLVLTLVALAMMSGTRAPAVGEEHYNER